MEILKLIFPYNLDGPDFLLFYILLLLVTSIFCYQYYAKIAKAELQYDIDHLHVETPYELAYLKGGQQMFYELIISELIEEGKLKRNGEKYSINKHIKLQNPIAIYLDTLNKETVNLNQVYKMAQTEFQRTKKKYGSLVELKDRKVPQRNKIIIIAFECIGLIRLCQGIYNDKAVGFLIFILFAGGIILYSLHSWPIRKKRAEKYFSLNWDNMGTLLTEYQKRLLTYGFTSICAGTILYHLYPFFNSLGSPRSFSSNSIYDSCGSDCGGNGCGSSCSGCGGCGGCGD